MAQGNTAVLKWKCNSSLISGLPQPDAGVFPFPLQLNAQPYACFNLLCLSYSGGFIARSDLTICTDRMQRATITSTWKPQLHTSSDHASPRIDYLFCIRNVFFPVCIHKLQNRDRGNILVQGTQRRLIPLLAFGQRSVPRARVDLSCSPLHTSCIATTVRGNVYWNCAPSAFSMNSSGICRLIPTSGAFFSCCSATHNITSQLPWDNVADKLQNMLPVEVQ